MREASVKSQLEAGKKKPWETEDLQREASCFSGAKEPSNMREEISFVGEISRDAAKMRYEIDVRDPCA